MPKVSIIVPVYNTEKYLKKCINSLLCQSEGDIEIIAIDDGSTDESGAILDRLAADDKRLIVVHKENGGVCTARNTGLDLAAGEWITFVDSDDWCDPNMIKIALSCVNTNDYDLVLIPLNRTDALGNLSNRVFDLPFESSDVTNHRDFIELRIISGHYPDDKGRSGSPAGSCCGKLVRKQLVDRLNHRFNPTLIRAEDSIFWIELVEKANRLYYVNNPLYYYREWSGGVTHGTKYIPQSELLFYAVISSFSDFILKYNKDTRFVTSLNYRIIRIIKWNNIHNFCNKQNPNSIFERAKKLKRLSSAEPYRTAIYSVTSLDKFMVYCLRLHLYFFYIGYQLTVHRS